jgi:hypothetical protein
MKLPLAAGGALLLVLLTWLLLRGIDSYTSTYAEAQRALDDFALAEASISRDVLQARAGLLGNYDVLVDAESAMDSAVGRIRLHAEAENVNPKPAERLGAAVKQYEDLVERFKSSNSLLQNSLTYVSQLSTDPSFGALGDRFAPSATALAAAVLHLARDSSAESAKSLQQQIDRFEAQAPTRGPDSEAAHAFLAHARLLSELLPQVEQILRALVASPTRQPLEETRDLLSQAQASFEIKAQRSRILLYVVALGLLVIALRLSQRLWMRTLKARRLVDANIIGIFVWDFDGRILEANQAFLNTVGYDHSDLVAGRIRWTDLTPPEWRDRDTRLIGEHKVTGSHRPFEKEYFRKDGSRVAVLIGVATFEEGGNQGVAFVVDLTERKRAEEALRRSEANLSEAQRLSHTGSWALSPATTRILYWSEECYRIWGFDPVQGLPERENVWRRIHPADRGRVLDDAEKALHQKNDYSIDFRIVLPDGAIKYLETIGHHRFSEQGKLIEVIGTNVDVTERKRAEEAIRESEYQLRQIIETVPGLVWSTGPDGEPTHLSQKVLDYSGLRFEDFLQVGWKAFMHPDDFPETLSSFAHSIQTGTPYHVVHRLRRADGEHLWHRAHGEPLRDREGRIIQWYGLTVDIDELKKAQDALRESEQSLRSAIDGIAGLVAIMAANGEVETVNRQVIEYFGRSVEELKNWGTGDAVHPEDLPGALEFFQRSITAGVPFQYELRLQRFDGEYRWFEDRIVPIRDDSGHIMRWYALLVDIEDRTRALERLQQVQSDLAHINRVSMMGELAASLSHEITQPIASARNNARAALNFLDGRQPQLGEVREALSCILGDTDRAGSIVDRIRAQVSKAPTRKAAFDLNESIDEVLVLARSAISKNGVSVQTRLAHGSLRAQGDRVQLQQVVLNLILNAVEAMGAVQEGPRELSISTERGQARLLVAIRDSGPGIDPANRDRVFEAFYTTKPSGVGMGLSISRTIIEAHGGRLWADANEPRGAVFRFTLPGVAESS